MAYKPNDSDRSLVEQYSQVGITQEDIARVLGITSKTLRKHYREELDLGAIKANFEVGGTLFRMATSGEHPACTIFWGKTKMGLREKDPLPQQEPGVTNIILNKGEKRKSAKEEKDPHKITGTE